jgi:TatD DNase family protein
LDGKAFDDDRLAAIERALASGVERFLAIGTGEGPPDLEAALRMCGLHPAFLATVGVHPHNSSNAKAADHARLVQLAAHPKVIAIGEIGLDYHYDFSPREVQQEVFIQHLRIAREVELPIVIHTREAWNDTLAILDQHWDTKLGGVFHCFTGNLQQAKQAIERNFRLGIGGVATYPRAQELREAISLVPIESLLLETDSPYLAPVPHRGRRNEPAYLPSTAQVVAQARGVSIQGIDAQTTVNFYKTFPKANSVTLEQLS